MNCIFTVRYQDDQGEWVDVFPGLTGDYEWAQRIAAYTWNRDGHTIKPEAMRIYKKCEGCLYELTPELCHSGRK